MIKVNFKDGFGVDVVAEYDNLGERLTEIKRITAKKVAADAPITVFDVARFNEETAIEKMFAEEKNRNFLDPVIVRIVAEGAEDIADALEVIATQMDRMGGWSFAQKYDALDLCNSASEFSIQFMTAYNKVFGPRY